MVVSDMVRVVPIVLESAKGEGLRGLRKIEKTALEAFSALKENMVIFLFDK